MGHWMINCREHTQMVSESMDRRLSFWSRASVKMHELLCPACNQLRAQLEAIRNACRMVGDGMTPEERKKCCLSKAAVEQIKSAMSKAVAQEKSVHSST